MLTGKMRFRTSRFGKAILQVQVEPNEVCSVCKDMCNRVLSWRDATIDEAEMALKNGSEQAKIIDPKVDWAGPCPVCKTPMNLTKKQTGWFCPVCNKVVPI